MVNGVAVPSWLSQNHLPCQSRTGGGERIYAERDDQSKPFGLSHMLVDPPMAAGRPRAAQLDVDGTMPHIRIRRATQLTVMAASSGPASRIVDVRPAAQAMPALAFQSDALRVLELTHNALLPASGR